MLGFVTTLSAIASPLPLNTLVKDAQTASAIPDQITSRLAKFPIESSMTRAKSYLWASSLRRYKSEQRRSGLDIFDNKKKDVVVVAFVSGLEHDFEVV